MITVKREADISSAFAATICNALNQLFLGVMVASSFASSGLIACEGLQTPDFVTVTRRSATGQLVDSSSAAAELMQAGIQPCGRTNPGDADESPIFTASESVKKVTTEPVSFIQVKRINFSMYGRELEILYRDSKPMIVDAIYQIAGYHVAYKCKYGFISSYKHTWATYLDVD